MTTRQKSTATVVGRVLAGFAVVVGILVVVFQAVGDGDSDGDDPSELPTASQDTFADNLFAEGNYCDTVDIEALAAAFVTTGSSDPIATDQGWSADAPQALCEQQLYSVDGNNNDVIDLKVVIEPLDQGTDPGEAISGRVPSSWGSPAIERDFGIGSSGWDAGVVQGFETVTDHSGYRTVIAVAGNSQYVAEVWVTFEVAAQLAPCALDDPALCETELDSVANFVTDVYLPALDSRLNSLDG